MNNLLCCEHSNLYQERTLLESEEILVMYIAHCALTGQRFFSALRCVNIITQEYERIGLVRSAWNGSAFERNDPFLERQERSITII